MLRLRSITRRTWLAIATCALLATGCKDAEPEAPRALVIAPVTAPQITAPTPAQEQAFVDAVMRDAALGNAASFNALIDWTLLTRRAARQLYAPPTLLDGIARGAKEGCVSTGVCASLAAVGQGKARLRYLGASTIESEKWLTFRRMPSEGGFDHLSFLLSVGDDRKARAIDVRVLSLGETSSETVRRALLPMLLIDEAHPVRRLQGTESAFAKHGAEISKAQQLASNGRAHEALTILNKLPAALRSDRFVMAQQVTVARLTGDERAYLDAIDALAMRHPNEPITVLSQLDAYALRQRFMEAIEVVGRIETLVTPDPYLDVLRSNLLTSANQPGDAAVAARRAIAREPDMEEAHWALVGATLKQADYAETTRALKVLRDQFHLTIQVEGVAEYAGYVASPHYAAFKAM